jgi:hypothetical protein
VRFGGGGKYNEPNPVQSAKPLSAKSLGHICHNGGIMYNRRILIVNLFLGVNIISGCNPNKPIENKVTVKNITSIIKKENNTLTQILHNTNTPTSTPTITPTSTYTIVMTNTTLPGLRKYVSAIRKIYEINGYIFTDITDIRLYKAIKGERMDKLFYITLAGINDILYYSSFGSNIGPINKAGSEKIAQMFENVFEYLELLLLNGRDCITVWETFVDKWWAQSINTNGEYHNKTICEDVLIKYDNVNEYIILTLEYYKPE